jgi:hypothetical protein
MTSLISAPASALVAHTTPITYSAFNQRLLFSINTCLSQSTLAFLNQNTCFNQHLLQSTLASTNTCFNQHLAQPTLGLTAGEDYQKRPLSSGQAFSIVEFEVTISLFFFGLRFFFFFLLLTNL